MQQDEVFQHWARERDSVEAQMDEILAAGVPRSMDERQARQMRFLALIERRDDAARLLLDDLRRRRTQGPVSQSDAYVTARQVAGACPNDDVANVSGVGPPATPPSTAGAA
jgi:hypothetical protein